MFQGLNYDMATLARRYRFLQWAERAEDSFLREFRNKILERQNRTNTRAISGWKSQRPMGIMIRIHEGQPQPPPRQENRGQLEVIKAATDFKTWTRLTVVGGPAPSGSVNHEQRKSRNGDSQSHKASANTSDRWRNYHLWPRLHGMFYRQIQEVGWN